MCPAGAAALSDIACGRQTAGRLRPGRGCRGAWVRRAEPSEPAESRPPQAPTALRRAARGGWVRGTPGPERKTPRIVPSKAGGVTRPRGARGIREAPTRSVRSPRGLRVRLSQAGPARPVTAGEGPVQSCGHCPPPPPPLSPRPGRGAPASPPPAPRRPRPPHLSPRQRVPSSPSLGPRFRLR